MEKGTDDNVELLKQNMDTMKQQMKLHYLEQAISSLREFLKDQVELREEDPLRTAAHRHLIMALLTRFACHTWVTDMDDCVRLLPGVKDTYYQAKLNRRMGREIYQGRDSVLEAYELIKECRASIDPSLLDKVIWSTKKILAAPSPQDRSEIASFLILLGNSHVMKFLLHPELSTLEPAINAFHEAESVCGIGSPFRYIAFVSLWHIGWLGFTECGSDIRLRDMVTYMDKAKDEDRKGREPYMLASKLMKRGESRISEAISSLMISVSHRAAPHPRRSESLNSLAIAFRGHFAKTNDLQDLENCVSLCKQVVQLRPNLHPLHATALNNLANALFIRFLQKGDLQDLNEAVSIHREALLSRKDSNDHAKLENFISLVNLATALRARFERFGNMQDIDDTISLLGEALGLLRPGHLDRPSVLRNLANALSSRFDETGKFEDLEQCIALHKEVLTLEPISQSPQHLGSAFLRQFRATGDAHILEESIRLIEKALSFRPVPHPERSIILGNLADAFLARYQALKDERDVENALTLLEQASTYETGFLFARRKYSKLWAEHAETHDRLHSALRAYVHTMNLLPQLASVDLTLEQRQSILTQSKEVAGNAARCAIRQGELETAITLLSTGRSVFWSQALQLRAPIDDLNAVNPGLAQRFRIVSRQLEEASHMGRDEYYHFDPDSSELSLSSTSTPNPSALAERRNQVLQEIRQINGFEGFLLPPSFESLQHAALQGPIVFLNTSRNHCDALVLHAAGSQHIPLLNIQKRQLNALKRSLELLTQDKHSNSTVIQSILTSLKRDMSRVSLEESDPNRIEEEFRSILEILWISVVEPIIRALQLNKTSSPERIWWCPTGIFAFLPIHAAGVYSDTETDCLSDYVISSYCSSPQDLIQTGEPRVADFKMLAVIEPEAPGGNYLPETIRELEMIKEHIPAPIEDRLIALIGSRASPNSIGDVLGDIARSTFVHFGCHGVQSLTNPLESFLLLSSGELTMSKIIRECQASGEPLAYLSACQTAKGDDQRPDESLSLVATMLFAGFRGVVGTMWSILDEDAPIVADVFYSHMFRNGTAIAPNVRDAACALHLATQELRNRGKPFRNWVPFVHFGI